MNNCSQCHKKIDLHVLSLASDPTKREMCKECLIKEMVKIVEEGREIRSKTTLEEIVRELLVMMAASQPAFEDRCRNLLEIMDSWEEYETK